MTAAALDTRPLRHWLHTADRPYLVVCCAEHPDPGAWAHAVLRQGIHHAVVQLDTCVTQASPAVLLELIAGGASGITVALDGCADREGAGVLVARASDLLTALQPLRATQERAGDERATTGRTGASQTGASQTGASQTGGDRAIDGAEVLPPPREHAPTWPVVHVDAVPMSRRALLGRPDGLEVAEPSVHPTERIVSALLELAGGQDPGTVLDGIPTGVPRLTAPACAGSAVCEHTCPDGALALTSVVLADAAADRPEMAQFQLTFAPGRCTDCGQCVQVCPERALVRSGEYLWSSLFAGEPVSLRVGLIRRCARCGTAHGRVGDLCAICAFRAANPFGSAMPPGWPEAG